MVLKSLPWTEKYRPKSFDEVSAQTETIAVLKKMVFTKNLPHLLFYGPAGTGKTSTILALSREIFGVELAKERVLELNASDERGIGIIRSKIKNFASLAVSKPKTPNIPPFKIIVLDEADWMTSDAQNALRRVMELYADQTRFCLICNYVSRIIAPIASRCSKFRFKPLPLNAILAKFGDICRRENLKEDKSVFKEIVAATEGDLRKGITLLQSSCEVFGEHNSADTVRSLSIKVPDDIIEKSLEISKSENLEEIKKWVNFIVMEAYPPRQVLVQLCGKVVRLNSLSDGQKAKICLKLSESDSNLNHGADGFLQLLDVFCCINDVILNQNS